MQPKIVPTVLVANKTELRKRLGALTGLVNRVQIDIIDGVFADSQTILPEDLEGLIIDFELDFHLMVDHPIEWIGRCFKVGADRITAQVERMTSQAQFVDQVLGTGKEAGLALDLGTNPDRLNNQLFKKLEAVLLMSVKAGRGGQKFSYQVIDKIKNLVEIRNKIGSNFKIQIDGGVKKENALLLAQAGAQELAIGSAITNQNPGRCIQEFKQALAKVK